MAKREPTDKVQLPVRMQEMLRADLEKSAKKNGLSLNAEVVARLSASLLDDMQKKNREAIQETLDVLKDMLTEQQKELAALRASQAEQEGQGKNE